MSKTYLVTAPYITVVVPTHDGPKLLGFYAGVTLPDGVSEESIQHHLDRGMIEEQASPEAATEPEGPPAQSAVKAEWVDYAVSQGAERADAEAQTKDDLIAAYGGA